MIPVLEAELARVRDEQRRLALRAFHVETALTRARMGVDDRLIRAQLQVWGVDIPEPATPRPIGPTGRVGPFATQREADDAADTLRKAGL